MKINFMHRSHLYRTTLLATLVMALLIIFNGCKKVDNKIPSEVLSHSKPSHKMKEVDLKLIADNLVSPLGVVALPENDRRGHDDRGHGDRKREDERLFIIDQIGKIWIIDKHGNMLPTPFLDITAKLIPLNPNFDERGLLGLAFHPNYKKNGRFYVYYNAPPRAGGPEPGRLWNNLSKIVEFRVSSNPNMADVSSERALLEIDDPQGNHNGGTLAFGPRDGHLYISIGDGGGANDVGPGHVEDWYTVNRGGNGQDLDSNLFGNILRIDVNKMTAGMPYGIPHDNPFVGRPGRDETYAYGLRNPYRFSFDMKGSHDLIAGDAGQLLYEEIDLIKKGNNYGWNVKEGRHCFNAAAPLTELPSCPDRDPLGNKLIDPVIEINNWQNPKGGRATTVIGGNVYRGHSIPQFHGKYIFGTFSQTPPTPNGELFIANPAGQSSWSFQEISLKSSPNDIGHYLKGFGQDQDGEVYLTVTQVVGPSGTTGKVFKLVPVREKDDEDDDDDDDDDED